MEAQSPLLLLSKLRLFLPSFLSSFLSRTAKLLSYRSRKQGFSLYKSHADVSTHALHGSFNKTGSAVGISTAKGTAMATVTINGRESRSFVRWCARKGNRDKIPLRQPARLSASIKKQPSARPISLSRQAPTARSRGVARGAPTNEREVAAHVRCQGGALQAPGKAWGSGVSVEPVEWGVIAASR
jgi:hypothetical protein